MAVKDDLEVLVNFGLFNDGAVEKLANVIRTVQSLSLPGGSLPGGADPGRAVRGPGTTAAGGEPRKRGRRGALEAHREEVVKLLQEGNTAAEIGKRYGVSAQTVTITKKRWGLTKPRKKRKK